MLCSVLFDLQPIGFVTFTSRSAAEAAKKDLHVRSHNIKVVNNVFVAFFSDTFRQEQCVGQLFETLHALHPPLRPSRSLSK